MKKQIITILAASGMAVSALAQGSVNIDASYNPGITTQGLNAINPATATTWYTGTMALAIWYAASASSNQLSAINAFLNVTGGEADALALLSSDGFVQVSTTTPTGSTVGSITDSVGAGAFSFAQSTIGLASPVVTGGNGYLALVGTEVGGTHPGWSGVVAFANPLGGNPAAVPAGTPALLSGWNTLNENLVLSAAVPEPGTLALAALGGASLLLFRRKK
jgi:hypothetical protein